MLDPELIQEVLGTGLKRGGRFAEIFVEQRDSVSARLDDGKVVEVVTGMDRGAGVRVVHGTAASYAFSNRLDRDSLLRVAEAAAASARGGESIWPMDLREADPGAGRRQPRAIPDSTEQPGGATPDSTEFPDRSVAAHPVERAAGSVPRERKVEWRREADDAARGLDRSVRQVVAGYGDSTQRTLIATSDGRWVEEERPRIRIAVQVVAARDGVIQTGFWGPAGLAGAEFLEANQPRAVAERAARQAVTMLSGMGAPAGEMPVVIGPGGGGILFHEACGHGLEADHVRKGASVYRGKLGEKLASPLVNGVDDATVPGAWGSFAFDDEGTVAQRTVLFEGGILTSYLYDRVRADADGASSTGNGRRQSYAHLPIPRMTNTYILAGEASADDVIADTRRGLYARTLGGGQVNPATGDFVFGITEAYLIENGQVTTPVRGANLVGNGIGILAAIDAVADDFETLQGICGKDGQGVPVGNGSPTIRIARMTVGGTRGESGGDGAPTRGAPGGPPDG